jgi:hypothetical protein
MPGILDTIKDTFGKATTKASELAKSEQVESFKGKAGEVAGKVGDKTKETYEKVSDKVDDLRGNDGGADAPSASPGGATDDASGAETTEPTDTEPTA